MKRALLSIGFLLLVAIGYAQSGATLFDDKLLHKIEVTIALENWWDTLDADFRYYMEDPSTRPEIAREADVLVDGIPMLKIGFRQKGNFSNIGATIKPKKPFKIEFDEFVDQRYQGLKSINLNNGTDDPSYFREPLSYYLLRNAGVVAPRTSFAKLFVNGEYWGLYTVVEQVDKVFLRDHFGSDVNDGNLYKTKKEAQAFLTSFGEDQQVYNDSSNLELKTNEKTPDWSRLIAFIHLINSENHDSIDQELAQVFDVETYLKVLAIEKLILSWDSYWGGGNNYYLYEHPDGRIVWIPWDMNETFGRLKGFDLNLFVNKGYLVPTNLQDARPLLNAIFSNETNKTRYLELVCNLLNDVYLPERIDTVLLGWHNLIADAVKIDHNKLYTYEAFEAGLTALYVAADFTFPKTGLRLPRTLPGIFPFINERRMWAFEQLEHHDFNCKSTDAYVHEPVLEIYPNPCQSNTSISVVHPFTSDVVGQLKLWDVSGKLVETFPLQQFIKTGTNIALPSLKSGFYALTFTQSNGSVSVGKLIVLK